MASIIGGLLNTKYDYDDKFKEKQRLNWKRKEIENLSERTSKVKFTL